MARLQADIRISLKRRRGKTYRIELIRHPLRPHRFWVRRDGTRSKKLPDTTATEIAEELRKWLTKQ